jgi:eukaryotic-like serine/threonine-protein kinase
MLIPPKPLDLAAPDDIATGGLADPEVTTGLNVGAPVATSAVSTSERYALGDEIARGGMGVVYRAVDTTLGREVAVKVLGQAASGSAGRFAEEARITAQLQHPAIPPVHDIGTLPDGRPFLAMKLIRGQTLEALLKNRSTLAAERGQFVAAFEQVCQAVGYAHSHRVIHRDLKPANVMVGSFGEVQVMDWGLAKILSTGEPTPDGEVSRGPAAQSPGGSGLSETHIGSILGTPAFMPPEQARGATDRVDATSDVFGLGGLLAVILTGRPPFAAGSAESTRCQAAEGRVGDCLARLDECGADPELVALCKACLRPNQAERPRDAGEVARAVAALRQAAEERARQADLSRVQAEGERNVAVLQAAEQRKRRRLQLALVGALGLLLAAGAGFAYWRQEQAGERRSAELKRQLEDERREAVERDRVIQNTEALTAHVRRCEELLRDGDPMGAGHELVEIDRRLPDADGDGVAARVARCRADLAVLRELDYIDRFRETPVKNQFPSDRAVATKWRAAFVLAGLDPGVLPPDEIARQVNESLVSDRLVASLDLWHASTGEADVRAILRAADPDPYRNALRDAFVSGRKEAVARLAEQPDALAQPPGFAVVLGRHVAVPAPRQRAVLETALRSRPGGRSLLMGLGHSYPMFQKDVAGERVRWFQAAAAAHPRFVPAYINLANSLSVKGDPAGAVVAYRQAIQIDPTYAPVHYNLGLVLAENHDLNGAVAEFQEAIRIDPTSAPARNELGISLGIKGDLDGAKRELREAIRCDPSYVPSYINLGIARLMGRDVDGAIADFREAVQRDPQSASARFHLGLGLATKGDLNAAIPQFEEAVRLQPDSAPFKQNLDRARKDKAERDSKSSPPPHGLQVN